MRESATGKPKPDTVRMIAASRTRVASTLRYSARPPQTPARYRSRVLRVRRRGAGDGEVMVAFRAGGGTGSGAPGEREAEHADGHEGQRRDGLEQGPVEGADEALPQGRSGDSGEQEAEDQCDHVARPHCRTSSWPRWTERLSVSVGAPGLGAGGGSVPTSWDPTRSLP